MNLTVPLQTLMGLIESPGRTPRGEVVPAGLARQLAADPDSVWYRMLTDGGRFVELSTKTYTPPAALRRSVLARDGTCAGIGCSRSADLCDTDHTRPYAAGGATREGNLGALCRGEHLLKDNGGGFTLTRSSAGDFRWTYPSGRTLAERRLRFWQQWYGDGDRGDEPADPDGAHFPGRLPVDLLESLSA